MIIDCHGHYTTAPQSLWDWRKRQVAGRDHVVAVVELAQHLPHQENQRRVQPFRFLDAPVEHFHVAERVERQFVAVAQDILLLAEDPFEVFGMLQ